MDIKELESFKLSDAVKFHDRLNPALWTEKGTLDPEVYDKLMEIAKDFMAELGIPSPKVEDITISGSNAAYSYTPHSDLDLHILVDHSKLPDNEVYKELFNAKKTVYNDSHDIKVHGVPVELYVQDSNQPHHSLGEYSLLKKDWNKMPVKRRANFDQSATKAKYENLGELIELAIKTRSLRRVEKVIDIIKRYRKAGLEKTGEFGPENLAYKALRKTGMVQKLWDLKNELHSDTLSLEDYDPNGPPPGPEFPPTMPKGTVKVDVSDVYDWYKLGQHISNMKGLGKHDFGKGPPSTILSFGDEDTEHKYIKDLYKTGLTTTDIDPLDPKQPKGIPKQKVDPTYNVGEGRRNWDDWKSKATDLPTLIDAWMNDLNRYFRNQVAYSYGEDDNTLVAKVRGKVVSVFDKRTKKSKMIESASGYIPSEKEKDDPRFKTALTVDIKPDTMRKDAKKFGNKISRAGIPPKLNTNGKF